MDIKEIYKIFPNEQSCVDYLELARWNNKPECCYCKSSVSTKLPKENRYHCNNCNTTYSVTVGTIFHHTHLPLQKWFLAIFLCLNKKKNLSTRQFAQYLEINRNTGWRIQTQIQKAIADNNLLLKKVAEFNLLLKT